MRVRFIIFGLGVFLIVTYSIVSNRNETTRINDYLNTLKVKFSGIVLTKDSIGQSIGKISIRLDNTNYNDYDPRDSTDIYLCVIKGDKAEVVMNYIDLVRIGDSVVFDGSNGNLRIYRYKKMKDSVELEKIIARSGLSTSIAKDRINN